MSGIEVHAFDSARMTLQTSMLVQMTDFGEETEICVPFYLIDHPEGVVLVDTGTSWEMKQDPENYGPHGAPSMVDFAPVIEMTEDDQAVHQVEDFGYSASEVDTVIMSHLHMDHAGGITDFPDAEFVVQQEELRYAPWADPVQQGFYLEGDYGALRTPAFDVAVANGRHDVFGDGRVVTIPTPGHTPGHQSVKLELDDETVILAMDLAHLRLGYEEMLATSFDWSTRIGNESRRKIRNLAQEEDADVFINHDTGDFERLSSKTGGLA